MERGELERKSALRQMVLIKCRIESIRIFEDRSWVELQSDLERFNEELVKMWERLNGKRPVCYECSGSRKDEDGKRCPECGGTGYRPLKGS